MEVPALQQDIARRMYDRQLARQQVEDDLARVEEMSESEKKDEPQTKRAKACLLPWRRLSSVIVAGLAG